MNIFEEKISEVKEKELLNLNLGRDVDTGGRYKVSLEGKIYSTFNGKLKELKGAPDQRGYLKVKLYLPNSVVINTRIHRLVLETYTRTLLGKAGDRMDFSIYQVDHIDMNRTNNNIDNLRWISDVENNRRKLNNHWNWSDEEKERIFDLYFREKKTFHEIRKIVKRDMHAMSELIRRPEAKEWCKNNQLSFRFRKQDGKWYNIEDFNNSGLS